MSASSTRSMTFDWLLRASSSGPLVTPDAFSLAMASFTAVSSACTLLVLLCSICPVRSCVSPFWRLGSPLLFDKSCSICSCYFPRSVDPFLALRSPFLPRDAAYSFVAALPQLSDSQCNAHGRRGVQIHGCRRCVCHYCTLPDSAQRRIHASTSLRKNLIPHAVLTWLNKTNTHDEVAPRPASLLSFVLWLVAGFFPTASPKARRKEDSDESVHS
jgi:hypothetical protein